MLVNTKDIFDFYENRIACHVKAVNYFASLLGYQFPEHDGDKVTEPIRTGYAFIFYKTYHKNFTTLPDQEALSEDAKKLHHDHATHHIQFYKNVHDIPNIRLYEMISDWASANFEQLNILHEPGSVLLEEWFNKNMADKGWSDEQLKIIYDSIKILNEKTDPKTVIDIWKPLLANADL